MFTINVQVVPPATEPSLKVIVPPPSGAVRMPPVQVDTSLAGVAIVTSAGRVSVNARSVTGEPELVLLIVKMRVEVAPGSGWCRKMHSRRRPATH